LDYFKDTQQTKRKDYDESNLSIQSDYEFHLGIDRATNT